MRNLKENLYIAVYYFYCCFKIFFEEYLTLKFGIVAYWFRFEWQGCGSIYCYGLYWLSGVPIAPIEGFVDDF